MGAFQRFWRMINADLINQLITNLLIEQFMAISGLQKIRSQSLVFMLNYVTHGKHIETDSIMEIVTLKVPNPVLDIQVLFMNTLFSET